MTDFDRNIRTLIVCFVLAIVALVPLRLVEIGNIVDVSSTHVLGETTEYGKNEIALPNADIGIIEEVER
jgi:hypothetical protein